MDRVGCDSGFFLTCWGRSSKSAHSTFGFRVCLSFHSYGSKHLKTPRDHSFNSFFLLPLFFSSPPIFWAIPMSEEVLCQPSFLINEFVVQLGHLLEVSTVSSDAWCGSQCTTWASFKRGFPHKDAKVRSEDLHLDFVHTPNWPHGHFRPQAVGHAVSVGVCWVSTCFKSWHLASLKPVFVVRAWLAAPSGTAGGSTRICAADVRFV